ncbi:M1 family aminopeptidase [Corallococcus terminator]|uniref:M1 family aminopeptidase n=1 Tax=Corallococcus terminator TaxID=2316733 RepID=UPI0013150D69|nr:M1 family aminopeptidase [Corallococcus terminator]
MPLSLLRRVLSLLVVLGLGCESPAPPPIKDVDGPPLAYAVDLYDLAFDLTTRELTSRLWLDVKGAREGCLSIPAPEGVTDVRWQGVPAVSTRTVDGTLEVCGRSLLEGAPWIDSRYVVPEATHLYTQVGFSRRPDLHGDVFSYLLGWVESCDFLGPCDDAPDRLSHFTFEVTHAPGAVVLCPGTLSHPDETHTRCELLGTRAPTYSAFMVASHPAWKRTRLVDSDVGRVDLYEAPGGLLWPALDAAVVEDFLRWMTARFGPLPYGPELRVAAAPTEWLGMEHPANIVLRDNLPLLPKVYANMALHTWMHEVVHQWAGNRTTLASARDYPWKEAVAEYLTYVYEDEHRDGEAASTLAYWDRLARTASYHLRPSDVPAPPFISFANDIYGSGPMILLLQLESLLGRAQVLAALQVFLAEPGARSIADLRAALEGASGVSLQRYFETWVDGAGEPDWPFFQVEWREEQALTLTVTQRTVAGTVYPCVVELELQGDAPEQRQRFTVSYGLEPLSATVRATVPLPPWTVRRVEVDPRNRLVNRRSAGLLREQPGSGFELRLQRPTEGDALQEDRPGQLAIRLHELRCGRGFTRVREEDVPGRIQLRSMAVPTTDGDAHDASVAERRSVRARCVRQPGLGVGIR